MSKTRKPRKVSKATILWKAGQKAGEKPAINDQFVAMGSAVLCLRHPWTAVSALMGKLWSTSLFIFIPLNFNLFFPYPDNDPGSIWFFLGGFIVPAV